MNNISRITKDALSSCETTFSKLLLYGNDPFDLATNTFILNASVDIFYQVNNLMVHFYRILYLFMLYFVKP